jgi:hypothetical protein
VSFVERGAKHSVQVDAETAYEAAALALKAFRNKPHVRGPHRQAVLEIRVEAPTRIALKVGDVLDWLYVKPATSPKQTAQKKRLRDLLADDRH